MTSVSPPPESRSLPQPATLSEAIQTAVTRCPVASGPYFVALQNGSLSREHFQRSQQQFQYAVRYFSRPLAALTARMPTSALRQGLMHNLAEEHGLVDAEEASGAVAHPSGLHPDQAHDRTFEKFLNALEPAGNPVASRREGPAVRAFNLGLMGACLMEPTDLAFACLGIIEYPFADLSALIGQAVVAQGWIPVSRLVHYQLHAEIDRRHAADLFRSVEPAWVAGGEARGPVLDGLALGLHLFDRLYTELYLDQPAHP
jgi:pyrroloquinoline-quinone synthase